MPRARVSSCARGDTLSARLAPSDPLVDQLVRSQNPDGGWPAAKGLPSSTEPTALAVMALTSLREGSVVGSTDAAVRWLVSRQASDGGWSPGITVGESSWVTPLAVLALATRDSGSSAAVRGGRWLLKREAGGFGWLARLWFRVSPKHKPDLDIDLKGWPWTAGTFSWVEPTAYALLALRRLGPALADPGVPHRIDHGERLLYDRMCPGGGWNYGNARVLGENLAPFADTTAIALIALQRHRARVENRQALDVLRAMIGRVRSGLALGWSILCADLYAEAPGEWRSLLRQQYGDTRFLGKTKPLALAVLALNDGARMFRA
jgi:hypothetical protein